MSAENLNKRSLDDFATSSRPAFPKRGVITAGMPYGNKDLHFGHIGGVFVPADMFARFLRNRLGSQNVLFVCGTDCYGSPIIEGHRKAVENEGFVGTIEDYVVKNHNSQKSTLDDYAISLDIYEGSGLGYAKQPHKEMTDYFFKTLYENGYLERLSTAQFYDTKAQMFLNGRQVIGRCPVQGCKSDKGYADECDLGHQYNPEELIEPKSTITDTVPELRPVSNWYFKLPQFSQIIAEHVENLREDGHTRSFVLSAIEEFLQPPIIYIQSKYEDRYRAVADKLPEHQFHEAQDGKSSFTIEFSNIDQRDIARDVLESAGVRFRTGKTLVPFRLTGNIDWGIEAPKLEDEDRLTVWCWPESLWAPISFTSAALQHRGGSEKDWRDWWTTKDCKIFQFIGEDNIYFYGVAQSALFPAMQNADKVSPNPAEGQLQQGQLIANHHLMFLNKKASSSGAIKPPMAKELLNYYNTDQLRAHFLALGLGQKSVSFQPKPFNPNADEKAPDPVLKESALLTNIFNRIARSCFYTAKKICNNTIPLGEANTPAGEIAAVDFEIIAKVAQTALEYERLMSKHDFHLVLSLLDEYLRDANKYWANNYKKTDDPAELDYQKHVLANTFYMLKIATVLMEPIAPIGTHKIFEYLNLDCSIEKFLNFEHVLDGFDAFVGEDEIVAGGHVLKELPPRTDFFEKHPSQFA